MVNVAQYQIVATGSTVSSCEQTYIQMLADKGISTPEELPQTQANGKVAEIRTAVLDGNTYYFIRLEGEEVFYSLSAAQNREVVTLNEGDTVTIDHAVPDEDSASSILDGYTLTIVKRALPTSITDPVHISEFQDSYNALDQSPVTTGSGLPLG